MFLDGIYSNVEKSIRIDSQKYFAANPIVFNPKVAKPCFKFTFGCDKIFNQYFWIQPPALEQFKVKFESHTMYLTFARN